MSSRILRKKEVQSRVGLSDATVYRLEIAGDFPKRVRLGKLSVGWHESEVDDWIAAREVAPLARVEA